MRLFKLDKNKVKTDSLDGVAHNHVDEALVVLLPKLIGAALAMLRNFEQSKDLAQEVCRRVLEKRSSFATANDVNAYAFRVLFNAVQRLKHANTTLMLEEVSDKDLYKIAENPYEEYFPNQMENILQEEVADLPPYEKDIITMFYTGGMSAREIATLLGVAEMTVRNHLKRINEKIRKNMIKKRSLYE